MISCYTSVTNRKMWTWSLTCTFWKKINMHLYRDLNVSIPTVPEGRAALPLALTTVFPSLARCEELTKCVSNDLVIYTFFFYLFLATLVFLWLWPVGATLCCGAALLVAAASLVAEHGP